MRLLSIGEQLDGDTSLTKGCTRIVFDGDQSVLTCAGDLSGLANELQKLPRRPTVISSPRAIASLAASGADESADWEGSGRTCKEN